MATNLRDHLKHSFSAASLRSYLAEFISTFLFAFAAVGSAVSARMVTPDVTIDAASLVGTGVAQAFGLFAAVFIAADISGGHVNPAVTFAYVVGGNISVPSALLYWASQMLGSVFACLVIHTLSAGEDVPTTVIAARMTGFGASVVEGVLTFMVVYTVHVAADPRTLAVGRRGLAATALGALAVGLVHGACVLASASLTGGSMNPAHAFGASVVSGSYKNQAAYWAGPMIGAAVAALLHQNLMVPAAPEHGSPRSGGSRHGVVEAVAV